MSKMRRRSNLNFHNPPAFSSLPIDIITTILSFCNHRDTASAYVIRHIPVANTEYHRQLFCAPHGNCLSIAETPHTIVSYGKGNHAELTLADINPLVPSYLSYVSSLDIYGGGGSLMVMPHFTLMATSLRRVHFHIPPHSDSIFERRWTFALNTLYEWCVHMTTHMEEIFVTACCSVHVQSWKRIITHKPIPIHSTLTTLCFQQEDIEDAFWDESECDLGGLDDEWGIDIHQVCLPNLTSYIDHFNMDVEREANNGLMELVLAKSTKLAHLELVCREFDANVLSSRLQNISQLSHLVLRSGERLGPSTLRMVLHHVTLLHNLKHFMIELDMNDTFLSSDADASDLLPYWNPIDNPCLESVVLVSSAREGRQLANLHEIVPLLKTHLIGCDKNNIPEWSCWKYLEMQVHFHPSFSCGFCRGVHLRVTHVPFYRPIQNSDQIDNGDTHIQVQPLPVENYSSLMA